MEVEVESKDKGIKQSIQNKNRIEVLENELELSNSRIISLMSEIEEKKLVIQKLEINFNNLKLSSKDLEAKNKEILDLSKEVTDLKSKEEELDKQLILQKKNNIELGNLNKNLSEKINKEVEVSILLEEKLKEKDKTVRIIEEENSMIKFDNEKLNDELKTIKSELSCCLLIVKDKE